MGGSRNPDGGRGWELSSDRGITNSLRNLDGSGVSTNGARVSGEATDSD